MDTVIVTLVANSGVTGGAVIFEVYDGASWLPVEAPTINDYTTVGSVTLSASYSKGFQVPVAGFPQFRVRLSTVVTGAGATLLVTSIVSSAPDVSLVTVGLDPAQPLPAGSNVIGAVTQSGAWNIGTVTTLPALSAGSNTIGNVNVSSLPALPAGSSQIGSVYVNNPVGAASVATAQASIGATASLIVAARTGVPGAGRVAVTIFNTGSATVYVGGSSVTTSTGMQIQPGNVRTLNTTAALYGIVVSGTGSVDAMETY